jgi:thioesterase domain-containing protein/acyl carrier protein
MAKAKVQNIFPLTYNQKILLFHHLSTDDDSGLIQVRCTIEGKINREAFKKAWAAVIEQYPVLRTSIQWKNLTKELQVVQQEAELDIQWIDLEGKGYSDNFSEEYEVNDLTKSLDLSDAPVSRVTVLKHHEDFYELLWTCHHILLDGWSSRLILEDVFKYYDIAVDGEELTINSLTPSVIDYFKAVEEQSLRTEAKGFWKAQIDDNLFPNKISAFKPDNQTKEQYKSIETSLLGHELRDFAKENHLTLTSLLQTAWLLTLKWFHQSYRVVTGTVVSGRAFDFPGIENIAGLLSNVIPIIYQFEPEQSFVEAAKQIQRHHAKARNFENTSIDQIKEWCHWEGNPNLFDTLLVIENFVQDDISSRNLTIKNYKSGLTTTYPITIAVIPEETIKISCTWNDYFVDGDLAKQLLYTFQEILTVQGEQKIDQIIQTLDQPPTVNNSENSQQKNNQEFVTASTTTEYELTKIWERVLDLKAIGVTDNFFALGGKSIQALQLFHEIEKKFDKTLLPSVLIKHSTIRQLSTLISDDKEDQFSSIVPLKLSGKKPPLFCIHAGGAHVFIYKELAESINEDYPVYAIQPKGLDGGEMHHSIEEMAKDYLNEIQAITRQQKIYLLGYCFSKVVCLEMARIAKEQNLEVELVIVDSAAMPWFQRKQLINEKKRDLIVRFGKKVYKDGWNEIKRTVQRNLERLNVKIGGSTKNQLEEIIVESDSDTEHHLVDMILNLNELMYDYQWNPVQTKVHLIRSSEYANLQNKNYHIDVWETLSKHQLTTYQVNGEHKTIFEGNSVIEMARTIEKIIGYEIE